MCGEKLAFFVFCPYVLGSPPHVRGKALFIKNHFPFVGITPACAGKRCTCCYACPRPTDHPRTCGEKAVLDMCSCHSLGSPPHMRGKVRFSLPIGPPSGITPAHAGKRAAACRTSPAVRDHPRTCGEKRGRMSNFSVCPGSPPHMRGKVPYHDNAWFLTRITPAHAGKSFPVRRSVLW